MLPEKLACTWYVTEALAGRLSVRLKEALFPATVAVPTGFPFNNSLKVTDPFGLPVPETDTVRFVIFTFEGLGLVIVTLSTLTFEAPGNWLELEEEPVFTCTVTWVGVDVGVFVPVGEAEGVAVDVALLVALDVGVSVADDVGVGVVEAVGVFVAVKVAVTV